MELKQAKQMTALVYRVMCLVLICSWTTAIAGTPFVSTLPEEAHLYTEANGTSVKQVEWQLKKDNLFVLTYSSSLERHVTTTGLDYDTRRWQVVLENEATNFTAERIGRTINVRGMFKGIPVDKRLKIDEAPWYQATSLSLRELIASKDAERSFWTIRLDTLTTHKIRAVKKGMEAIESGGVTKELFRIQLTLSGLLAPFWKSDYWFAMPEGIFSHFRGPSGPPGSPVIIVTRIDS